MRVPLRAAIAALAAAMVVPAVACVLADPPASIPPSTLVPPEIDHELVQPPVTDILRAWPDEFVIPVLVLDPSSVVVWRAFIDYDVISGTPFVAQGELTPDQAGDDAGVRVLTAHVPAPADLSSCHTLEVLVALGFDENHTPSSVGGDSVTWFYSPSGSLDGCPVFDAGPPDGAVVDAGADVASDAEGGSE